MSTPTLSMMRLTTPTPVAAPPVSRLGRGRQNHHRGASLQLPGGTTSSCLGACRHPNSGVRRLVVGKKSDEKKNPSFIPRAAGGGDGGANGGSDGGEMDTGILYERMKKLQAKEAAENSAVVEAAIEKEQAIVAGIRGDAAERPIPSEDDFAALVEHLLSTPMEAMDYEGVRCGPLLTKDFLAYVNTEMRKASSLGPAGEDTLCELQALELWVRLAREKQAERDDAIRRRQQMAERAKAQQDQGQGQAGASSLFTGTSSSPQTPVKTVGEKFRILMSAAAEGVDTLRGAIIELARAGEIDDVLLVMLNSNGDNARDSGDEGRANFLYKLAEVCVREKNIAEEGK